MLQSKLFCKTKREAPREVEAASHKFLIRGDFVEQSFAGVYRFLPLGVMVLRKIENIIRQKMFELGAQEVILPALQNKSLWLETGRWDKIDPPLFKFKDRHEREIALGSTHEEEITDSFRHRVELPVALFQIQTKFRNEMRSTGGLLRAREFLMKDLYSFHSDEGGLKDFYEKVKKTYFDIFKTCGLKALCVEADSGTIGGSISNEFMIISAAGEDRILICDQCGFAANVEKSGKVAKCPKCQSILRQESAIEIGHIFSLGEKYSQAMSLPGAVFMGCYGIGLPRLMATIVEKNRDERGIIWPETVAPFQVHLLSLGQNEKSEKLYQDLQKQGVEVLYDDRVNKTAGEKFAEADLLGIPTRMVVSAKTLEKDSVEIKKRNEKEVKLVGLAKMKKYVK